MPAGMTVYGDNGQLQVTDIAQNLGCIASGTHDVSTNQVDLGNGLIATKVPIPSGANMPILALKPRNPNDYVIQLYRDGNFILCAIQFTSNSTLMDYWVFAAPTGPLGFGLEVRDANNNVTFQAISKPIRVVGAGDCSIEIDQPAGKVYAGVQGTLGGIQTYYFIEEQGNPATYAEDYQWYALGKSSATHLRYSLISFSRNPNPSFQTPPPDVNYGGGSYLFVDVTNY